MTFKQIGIRAAKEAGVIIMQSFRKKKNVRIKYGDQIVTTVDEMSQKKILSIILDKYPDHSIIAEENVRRKTSSPYTWYIDPIDGTQNFVHDLPYFCVSIGLQYHDYMILGIVYDPCRKDLFCAERGKGAYLNGKKIFVSKERKLSQSLLIFDAALHREKNRKIKNLDFFSTQFSRIRMVGAAALDLAYVAQGVAESAIVYSIHSWDIAAGCLLVEEAGGKVTNFSGDPWYPDMGSVIATNGHIHEPIKKGLINKN